ncbi:tRNA-dependent cyclodipeptide synthase [Streptomyces similanensis]
MDHPEYRRAHAYVRQAIEHPDFRPLCREGTREALKARMPAGWEPTEEQVDAGLLHSERALPFTINAAGILGVPEAVVAYSRPAAQAKYFFTEGSAFHAFPGQAYIGLRVRE